MDLDTHVCRHLVRDATQFPLESDFVLHGRPGTRNYHCHQTGATLIRPYVERLRPSNLENPISDMVHIVNGRRGGRYGFPSCHAANTFGLAFFIWFLFRKRWLTVFMMGWALLTCYSRIYLGVHYPGDLIVGTLIGLFAAYIVYRLFLKVSGHKTMEKVPHIYAPILVGGLTIVGILIYSTVMIL